MALKTDNTQESRQFNPTSGEYNYLTKTGSFTLSQDNEQVTIPNGSDLMVVDLGITIDRSDAQITVGGNVLEVIYFVSKSDLVGVELGTGKCAILTEEPNFRTVIYLDVAQLNKSMSFQVSSLNNSLPSYELNDIARQLNSIGGSPVIPDTGNILDGGTADFRVQLTNPSTTRTLANGEVLGQTATIFNSTANTITITDGSNTFEIPTQEVFTLTWNGAKWATLKYQINEIFVQLPFQKSPDYFDNGTWEDVTDAYGGAYFRALGGSSEAWEVLQKEHLPNIWGSVQAAVDVVQLVETKEVDGIFVIPEVSTKPTASSSARTITAPFGIKTDASVLNYGTEENPIYIYTDDALKQHVNADNYGIRLWKKTAY